MNCSEFQTRLLRHGSPEAALDMESREHVAECRVCQATVSLHQRLHGALEKRFSAVEPVPGFSERLQARVRREAWEAQAARLTREHAQREHQLLLERLRGELWGPLRELLPDFLPWLAVILTAGLLLPHLVSRWLPTLTPVFQPSAQSRVELALAGLAIAVLAMAWVLLRKQPVWKRGASAPLL